MSALPPKADINGRSFDVCFEPEADIQEREPLFGVLRASSLLSSWAADRHPGSAHPRNRHSRAPGRCGHARQSRRPAPRPARRREEARWHCWTMHEIRTLNVGRYAVPIEMRVQIGEIGRRGIAKLFVHPHLFKFVIERIGFTKIVGVSKLAN